MADVRVHRRLLCVVVSIVIGVSGFGCNLYGGLEPSRASVEDLLADARVALTTGHPQRAVRLLETAYERDSTDVRVRIELANALYAAHDVDVIALRAAVERLNGNGDVSATAGRISGVCSVGTDASPPPDQLQAVALNEALSAFVGHRAQLRRASRLLVEGVLGQRGDAFAAVSEELQAKGYLLAALTRMGRRLMRVRTVMRATESTLYVDGEADPPTLVACSPTKAARQQVEGALCRLRDGSQQALAWLRLRNDRTDSDQAALLIDVLSRHRAALDGRFSCSTASDGGSSSFPQHASAR